MAYIYGSAAQGSAWSRRKDILVRLILPLAFVLILAGVGLYAFKQGQHWLAAIFAVFFVASVLRFEELGLTVSHYLAHSQASARAGQVAAKALEQLPNEYHVFHDLHFNGNRIDHAVIGPNGLFLIRTSSRLGTISAAGDSLRLNGWPFLLDMLSGCWNQARKLTQHMALHCSSGVRPCPVLCFCRAGVEIQGPVRGALVVEAGNLVPVILGHEECLPADRVHLLIDKLSELVNPQSQSPICTKEQSEPTDGQPHGLLPKPHLPVCVKCDHQATQLEFELFPGECPKCGRLYSFVPDASEEIGAAKPLKSAWKPTIPQLSLTVVLIAGCAGYLAHWQGFLTANQFASRKTEHTSLVNARTEPAGVNTSAFSRTVPVSENTQQTSLAQAASEDTPSHTNSRLEGNIDPTRPAPESGTNAAASAGENMGTGVNDGAVFSSDAAMSGSNGQGSSLVEYEGMFVQEVNSTTKTAETGRQTPAESFTQGKLSVTSSRPLIIWLRHQQTFKEFGPYEIRADSMSEINLPKGFYNVEYVESGKRRQTTMSFLSNQGRLEF